MPWSDSSCEGKDATLNLRTALACLTLLILWRANPRSSVHLALTCRSFKTKNAQSAKWQKQFRNTCAHPSITGHSLMRSLPMHSCLRLFQLASMPFSATKSRDCRQALLHPTMSLHSNEVRMIFDLHDHLRLDVLQVNCSDTIVRKTKGFYMVLCSRFPLLCKSWPVRPGTYTKRWHEIMQAAQLRFKIISRNHSICAGHCLSKLFASAQLPNHHAAGHCRWRLGQTSTQLPSAWPHHCMVCRS